MNAVFSSDPAQLCDIRLFVRTALRESAFTDDDRELLVLAVDEACTNVIRHAYASEPGRPIEISAECSETHVRFLIRDHGTTVDPECIRGRCLDELRPGGLGVFFMRKAFDEICYHPRQPGTELELVRRIPPTV